MTRLLIYLCYIPGVAWLFFRVLLPLWNGLISNIEAIFYLDQRFAAKSDLDYFQRIGVSAKGLTQWYIDENFKWNMDPMRGILDFSSKPWVSIAKNYGDCDDMMLIAEYILKGKYEEGHRCYVYKNDGSGHAIYLLKSIDGIWTGMSNQTTLITSSNMEDVIKHFYGDDTWWWYVI